MTVYDITWMDQGLCRKLKNQPTEADWYSDAGTPECQRAVAICRRCSVAENCLKFALSTEERFGVWGGFTPAQRDALARGVSREQVLRIRRTHSRLRPQKGSSAGAIFG